ncbi:MAG: aminotransferase class V-fold PLP-dependent enzyme [Bacteroidales bacterium]|nr:aminotransferase class V-fold PLP-dependent enzyme [Bacteroidales bacterium]
MKNLEEYFSSFRDNIIGINQTFESPFGTKKIIYADWIASGRLYKSIEDKITNTFGPFVGNTHTESSVTGVRMTQSYQWSHQVIKKHVNANDDDVIITAGSGMTKVINKFQRILGLKYCSRVSGSSCQKERTKPVVFLTHMEHHSNQTSWYETNVDVVVLKPDKDLLVDPEILREELEKYKDREFKIGSFTACSNVTGIPTPIHKLARIMHEYGGVVFVDYAASAPYSDINMHPEDSMEKLDAVLFSPHKFLGGPGSSGVLIFDASMYHNEAPDNPGGGTVDWTNPWGKYKYVSDIEAREDGGTPGFLQSIRTALCINLKNKMGVANIIDSEMYLLDIAFKGLKSIKGVKILAENILNRLGIISFYIEGIHYNLVVQLLNDLYGIQVRGGCACAGTYGHFLLEVSYERSLEITDKISHGDLSEKPGWIRWSLHPTTTVEEVNVFLEAVEEVVKNYKNYEKYYKYSSATNSFRHQDAKDGYDLDEWFGV